ncbi:MAG: transcriptional regulator, partial [Microcoleus sp. Co-bin12]|nr:transcriptional regulator [Microcoleus sp. Co-bin12]
MKMRIKTTLEKMSPNSAVNVAISQPREVNDTPTCDRPHLVDSLRAGDIQTKVLN